MAVRARLAATVLCVGLAFMAAPVGAQDSPQALVDQASALIAEADGLPPAEALARLQSAQSLLDQLVADFPASDLAVLILLQDAESGVDVVSLGERIAALAAAPPKPAPPEPAAAAPDPVPEPEMPEPEMPEPEMVVEPAAPASDGPVAQPTVAEGYRSADCDRLAASPLNSDNPPGILGVPDFKMDVPLALAVCAEVVRNEPDNLRARYNLAYALYSSSDPTEVRKSVEIFMELALEGYPMAEWAVGQTLLFGDSLLGIPQDTKRGLGFLQSAIDAGLPVATYTLGIAHDLGIGVPVNEKIANTLYHQAADAGVPDAMLTLGWRYLEGDGIRRDKSEGIRRIKLVAEGGHAVAQGNLGRLYLDGTDVPQDLEAAFRWTSRAAEQDELMAISTLAYLYEYGKGTAKDPAMAASLYYEVLRKGRDRQRVTADVTSDQLAQDMISYFGRIKTRSTLTELQKLLAQNGFYDGSLDGAFGPGTRRAMESLCQC